MVLNLNPCIFYFMTFTLIHSTFYLLTYLNQLYFSPHDHALKPLYNLLHDIDFWPTKFFCTILTFIHCTFYPLTLTYCTFIHWPWPALHKKIVIIDWQTISCSFYTTDYTNCHRIQLLYLSTWLQCFMTDSNESVITVWLCTFHFISVNGNILL